MDKTNEASLLEALARLEARLDAMAAKPDHSGERRAELAQNLHDKVNDLSDAVTDYIKAHPVRSATIAFLLGVALASRRGGR